MLNIFKLTGKSNRLEFNIISILTYLSIIVGATVILGSLFSGTKYNVVNNYIRISIIVNIIFIYLWIAVGVKRCRSLKLPISVFIIPLVLLITSFICSIYINEKIFFLTRVLFIVESIVLLALALLKSK